MSVETDMIEITKPTKAIVMFGIPTDTSGYRGGEYLQCTIDPQMVSPSGEFIRFQQYLTDENDIQKVFQGGEINGWQRIDALTICEVLGDVDRYEYPKNRRGESSVNIVEGASVKMRAIR